MPGRVRAGVAVEKHQRRPLPTAADTQPNVAKIDELERESFKKCHSPPVCPSHPSLNRHPPFTHIDLEPIPTRRGVAVALFLPSVQSWRSCLLLGA